MPGWGHPKALCCGTSVSARNRLILWNYWFCRKTNSRCQPLVCLAHNFSGKITKHCCNVNWGLSSKCCSMVIWFKAKKMCMSTVCAPACLKMFACPLLSDEAMNVEVIDRLIWARPPLDDVVEARCLLTVNVTSVNAGCLCINVYIYSLTYSVFSSPKITRPSFLPSSNLLVVLERQRWEQERALQ